MKKRAKLLIVLIINIILTAFALLHILTKYSISFSSNISSSIPETTTKTIRRISNYDSSYEEATAKIDLSDLSLNSFLLSELSNSNEASFENQRISTEIQQKLEEKYPYINFKWDVSLLDGYVSNDVEELDLSKTVINDIESFKTSLRLLHNLKYIDMCDCNLSNEELDALRQEFPNIKIVWRIHLGKWSLRTDAVAFSVLVVHFDYRRMTSKDIEVLKYCTDLQALDLGHQSITDISVIGDYLPELRLLILADNQISDITPISKLKHLHYLELFMNNISDITPLLSCKELVDLNLAHIPALYDFSPMIDNKFPLLERLCMQNSGGTSKYYNAMRETYPDVKIVHTGYGSTHSGWRSHKRYFAMIDMFYKRDYISELFTQYDNMVE